MTTTTYSSPFDAVRAGSPLTSLYFQAGVRVCACACAYVRACVYVCVGGGGQVFAKGEAARGQPSMPRGTDALEGKAPQRWPQRRLDRRLEEVAKAVGGGYCRLQMPLELALAVRGTASCSEGALSTEFATILIHREASSRDRTSLQIASGSFTRCGLRETPEIQRIRS